MKRQWEVGCHALVAGFVARRIKAEHFLRQFDGLWPEHGGEHGSDAVLTSIRGLCANYSCALPDNAGYRVSEEQFRQEVQVLAAHPPSAG